MKRTKLEQQTWINLNEIVFDTVADNSSLTVDQYVELIEDRYVVFKRSELPTKVAGMDGDYYLDTVDNFIEIGSTYGNEDIVALANELVGVLVDADANGKRRAFEDLQALDSAAKKFLGHEFDDISDSTVRILVQEIARLSKDAK